MRDLFNSDMPEIAVEKPIRLIELFAGYSSQAMALRRIGADFEIWHTSEWLWQSNRSHLAVFHGNACPDHSAGMTRGEVVEALLRLGVSADEQRPMTKAEIERKGENWQRRIYSEFKENRNLGSIVNIRGSDLEISETDKYFYIMTYSFPCQDLSVAGKMAGMAKGGGTRSGLLWEVERLLRELKGADSELPQCLFMENVPQVCGEQNGSDFNKWTAFLQKLGYTNYLEILNAKDYGVAQNRERAFMFSFLGEVYYEFPKPARLEKRLKDYLEDKVDEKYYLNSEKAGKLIAQVTESESAKFDCAMRGGGYKESALTERSTNQGGAMSRTASGQGTTAESATCVRKELSSSRTLIPCKLNGVKNGEFLPMRERTIRDVGCEVASTIPARYYKGAAGNGDNMVIERSE